MATPVKTLLLQAFKDALENINGIDKVIRNPSKPATKETVVGTLAHLWDEQTTITERNRIDVYEMPVQIDIWFPFHEDSASDEADLVEAEVIKHIPTDAGIRQYAMRIAKDPSGFSDKDLVDEFLFALVMRFIVTFSTVAGDPYTLAKAPSGGS